jgi:hypothetical protein
LSCLIQDLPFAESERWKVVIVKMITTINRLSDEIAELREENR